MSNFCSGFSNCIISSYIGLGCAWSKLLHTFRKMHTFDAMNWNSGPSTNNIDKVHIIIFIAIIYDLNIKKWILETQSLLCRPNTFPSLGLRLSLLRKWKRSTILQLHLTLTSKSSLTIQERRELGEFNCVKCKSRTINRRIVIHRRHCPHSSKARESFSVWMEMTWFLFLLRLIRYPKVT